MTRVGVVGCAGRVGQALVREAHEDPTLTLAAASELAGAPAVGRDAGVVAGLGEIGVKVTADEAEVLRASQVVIDFTSPAGSVALARRAAEMGVPLVIGTTGLSADEQRALVEAARKIAIVWAPNMSVGVNVFFRLAGEAARLLGADYSFEIIESHHRHKKDAPSGTALRLAEILAEATPELGPLAGRLRHGREGLAVRQAREIGVHAVRGGDIVGEHTVMYCGDGDRLELTVRASSRQAYARGAMRAARWVVSQGPGLYDMVSVLGI